MWDLELRTSEATYPTNKQKICETWSYGPQRPHTLQTNKKYVRPGVRFIRIRIQINGFFLVQVNRFLMTMTVIVQHRNLYFSIYAWIRHPDPQQEKCLIRIRNKINFDSWHCRQKPKQINVVFLTRRQRRTDIGSTRLIWRCSIFFMNLPVYITCSGNWWLNQKQFSFSVIQVFIKHWKGSDE